MIDAFEAGTKLTAHASEIDAQAAIAHGRSMLDNVALEVQPDPQAGHVVAAELPQAVASPIASATPRDDDTQSALSSVLAALRAVGERDEGGEPSLVHVPAAPLDSVGSTASAAFDEAAVLPAPGGVLAAPEAAFRPTSGAPDAPMSSSIGRPMAPWPSDFVARQNAGSVAEPSVLAAGLPLPWMEQDMAAPRDGADPAVPDTLAVVLRDVGLLGSNGTAGSRAVAANASAGGQRASPLFSDPAASTPMAMSGDHGVEPSWPWQALPVSPENEAENWTFPSVNAVMQDAGMVQPMVPPVPSAEPVRTGAPDASSSEMPGLMSPESPEHAPIVVHATLHLDGSVLAHAVSEHIVAGMNGPLTGTGGFDPRRSYTPVEG